VTGTGGGWLPPDLAARFRAQQAKDAWRSYRVACALAASLFLSGVALDALSQPQALRKLLAIRLATSLVCFVLYLAARRGRHPLRTSYGAGLLVLTLSSASITAMCLVLDGYRSPYYAGINLVVLAAGVLFPWNTRQMGAAVGVIVGTYLLAVLVQAGFRLDRVDLLVNNLFFLGCTSVIGVSSSALQDRLRRESFARLARIEEYDRQKSQFFANISHELRTPLTLVLGPVAALLARTDLDAETSRGLQVIQRNARTLLKHVNDLLEAARGEAGRLAPDYQRIDLAALTTRVASLFEARAEERHITFVVKAPAEAVAVDADPAQMGRVLTNLLANAFKFTPEGGQIRCELRLGVDNAILEVADSGPGIPAPLRERVFERFFQVEESTTRTHGGTGLGLAIVRDLLGAHGGRILAQEAPEGGALMHGELPLRAPADAVVRAADPSGPLEPLLEEAAVLEIDATATRPTTLESAPTPTAAAGTTTDARPRVLVVEDHPEMREFIAHALSERYLVETAPNAQQGLARAQELPPDLVLSDLMMPGMSGTDLLRAVRARPELARVPFVVLTAKAEEELRVELLEAGAQDFVLKPFSAAELRARVGRLVEVKRATDEIRSALAQRQDDIETAARDVVAALRLRDEFLTNASHELFTPITSLSLQVQAARRRLDRADPSAGDPATWKRTLDRAGHQIERLTRLVRDMLDVSRVKSGRLDLRPARFDLAALVRQVGEGFDDEAREVGSAIQVSAAESLEGEWDRDRIEQVLTNLVANAIKYGAGKPVELRAALRDGQAEVAVIDRGIGIAPADQQRIFGRFERAVSSRAVSGLGLGLYIAHQLVLAHGGEIVVQAEEGLGSTFRVRLPLSRPLSH
jgi:signal transduction histidine kinase